MIIAVPAGEHTDLVGAYMTEKTGMVLQPGLFTAFMFIDENKDFKGAAVVSNYRVTDCELSTAAETAMAFRPHVFRAVFTYIFEQLGCRRCTCIVRKNNKRGRALVEATGFTLEGNLRKGFDGVRDALIYGLLKEECRFLGALDNGEEVSAKSPRRARSRGDGASTRADE